MLTTPQAIKLAPNSLYLTIRAKVKRRRQLRMGLRGWYQQGGARPIHWMTMSSQYRKRMSTRVTKMQVQQNTLIHFLPQKWLRMAWSRSGWLPVWQMHRQQEQQLISPVTTMTMSVSSQPAWRAMTGKMRMRPPIMPLTMQRMAMGPERCQEGAEAMEDDIFQIRMVVIEDNGVVKYIVVMKLQVGIIKWRVGAGTFKWCWGLQYFD